MTSTPARLFSLMAFFGIVAQGLRFYFPVGQAPLLFITHGSHQHPPQLSCLQEEAKGGGELSLSPKGPTQKVCYYFGFHSTVQTFL